ncbi:Uncharacterised protein [Mycobacteroides abscessus subsp. abscessus]|nr:hypothetical protein AOT86_01450 [Mycobacteroides sp. H072]KRQ50527.1 hypothetical protein AOT85_13570 [Mycobacteroides sp. H054]OHT58529.1 hypothetical protein BKG64_17705 [Mycobacteroides chelonae]SHR07005.1 Uncharacterised protein [Mycobacteroides abscessus subsp. abscessus]OHT64730.1 hypothetical protein BKG65_08840 [Mycobacteroides chelonae]
MVWLDTQSLSMSDIAHLHPLMQEALRTGAVPSREELARLLGKKIEDIPRPDDEDEKNTAELEDPDAEVFRARYRAMVDERLADWLADERERDAGSLFDLGDRTVPVDVRQQIEQDCQRRIQQEWRTYLQRRDDPDDDDGGSPTSWMQSVQ